MIRNGQKYIAFAAQAATGYSPAINCKSFKNAIIQVVTTGSANFTMKVQGSIQGDDLGSETVPDFTAAAASANAWSYVQCIDYDSGVAVNGSTGISTAGTDVSKLYEVNTNGLEWLCLNISTYAAGTIHVDVLVLDNQ